jgi:hypothetical protein
MNLQEKIDRAAFWHERFCLMCAEPVPEDELECSDCGGSRCVVPAFELKAFTRLLKAEWDEDSD